MALKAQSPAAQVRGMVSMPVWYHMLKASWTLLLHGKQNLTARMTSWYWQMNVHLRKRLETTRRELAILEGATEDITTAQWRFTVKIAHLCRKQGHFWCSYFYSQIYRVLHMMRWVISLLQEWQYNWWYSPFTSLFVYVCVYVPSLCHILCLKNSK